MNSKPIHGFLLGIISLLIVGATRLQRDQSSWRVSLHSYGPVVYGMKLRELSRVLAESLDADTTSPDACDYVFPKSFEHRAAIMVIGGVVERVDVDSASVQTISGVHVGSTETEVQEAYPGRIQVKPHPYTGPEGHYLVFVPKDPADTSFGLIFETDGKTVTHFRAGRRKAVGYIEGCS